MGYAVESRSLNGFRQGQTEELVSWINKIKCKKNNIKKKRYKNYRVEAVLSSALYRAITDLRLKQQQRYERWQRVKMDLYKNPHDTCGQRLVHLGALDKKTCEDLDSIDCFMIPTYDGRNSFERKPRGAIYKGEAEKTKLVCNQSKGI